ncbi:type II toxin-antitoxin system CcdA family antitoxin [Devosia neptuniae]|uniref:Type II toxin-antitoxin system CcdA family antitoxin n=1 Tax=Devosia neptuniae TaxID=191302 RepID=A0ABY6CFT9_9HYPH|nr:type II toxin-antitoxin system CcdA family antitoxin [Devosia neptuniae]UXN70077.1 type II toxin-antitoxin system CcdA family antitoxin [Devosia neptuniae]
MASAVRRATNVTINQTLLDEAKGLGLNISRAAETGIETAVRAEKERLWQVENAEAIQSSNDYVEKYGLPLAKYRVF